MNDKERKLFEQMRTALQEAFEYFDSCYDGPDNDTDGMGNTFYGVEEALRAADMYSDKSLWASLSAAKDTK